MYLKYLNNRKYFFYKLLIIDFKMMAIIKLSAIVIIKLSPVSVSDDRRTIFVNFPLKGVLNQELMVDYLMTLFDGILFGNK